MLPLIDYNKHQQMRFQNMYPKYKRNFFQKQSGSYIDHLKKLREYLCQQEQVLKDRDKNSRSVLQSSNLRRSEQQNVHAKSAWKVRNEEEKKKNKKKMKKFRNKTEIVEGKYQFSLIKDEIQCPNKIRLSQILQTNNLMDPKKIHITNNFKIKKMI